MHKVFHPSKKSLFYIFIGVIVVGLPLLVNAISLEPGVRVANFLINRRGNLKPTPDYPTLEQDILVTKNVTIDVTNMPEARLDVYQPKQDAKPRPILLWIHGGGYIGSSKDDTRVYATLLAHEGYTVASLEYTVAPAAHYPVPVHQANAALRYLADHAAQYNGDPSRVFVAGNSSGAQIASQVAAIETNPNLASAMHLQPALQPNSLRGVVLNCGVYDMSTVNKMRPVFFRVSMWAYTGYRDWMNFPDLSQLSTVNHVTSAYPPVFLTVGDGDSLEMQSFEFEAVLRRNMVPVTALYWNGSGANLPHDYQFDLVERPQAREAFGQTSQFLKAQSQEISH